MKTAIALTVLVLLGWSSLVNGPASAVSDPRFFGIYCGQERFEECVRYRRCLGRLCGRWRTRCEAVEADNIRLRVA